MQITIWGANTQATVLAVPLLGVPTLKGDKGDPGEVSPEAQARIDAAIEVNANLAAVRQEMEAARAQSVGAAGQTSLDRVATGQDRSITAADRAQTEADRTATEHARRETEAYADAGASASRFYDSIAAGRAAVEDRDTFGVRAWGVDGLARPTTFRRDSATTHSLINDQVTGSEFDALGLKMDVSSQPLLSLEGKETGDVAAEIYQDAFVTGRFRVGIDADTADLLLSLTSAPGSAVRIGADGAVEIGGAKQRALTDAEISNGKIWAIGNQHEDVANITDDGTLTVGAVRSMGPVRVGACVIEPIDGGGVRIVSDAAPDTPFEIGADGSMAVGGSNFQPTAFDGFAIGDRFGGDAFRVTADGRVLMAGYEVDLSSLVPKREIGNYPASVRLNEGGSVIPASGNDNYGLRRFNPFRDPDTIYVVFAFGQSLQVLSPNMLRAPWEPEADFPKSVNGTTYASRADLYAAWAAQGITGLTDAQYATLETDYYRPLSTADRNPYPQHLLMPDCGSLVNERDFSSLVPMAEAVKITGIGGVGGTPGTESPSCRMLWKFMELLAADFPNSPLPTFVLVNVARGGSTMNNVGTGRLWYNDAIRCLKKIKAIAAAGGKTVTVPFYWYKGGEAEFDLTRYAVPGDSASGGLVNGQDYEALLYSISRERERFDEVVKSITAQTWNVRALVSQVQRGTTALTGAAAAALVPKVTQAQFDARKLPYCIFTAPMWACPTNIYDYVHPTVVASTHDGERHGYIVYKAMCSVEGWQPLHVRSFYRTGATTFEARFNRQIRFLTNDDFVEITSLGNGKGLFMGQYVAGSAAEIPIASVALKPGTYDTVLITTAVAPDGYGIYLDNALHGNTRQSYNRQGCRSAIVGINDFGNATFHPNDSGLGTTNVSASEVNNVGAAATIYPSPFPLFDLSAHQRIHLNNEVA
ncbi:hypothetical protein ACEUZ9_002963 [Paracoccus litorisediminis]|uniref:hypothetical protein n=1 Tax=Paracoccus litorisediminis TaxID=2006130 RepID=UPI00372EF1CD